MREETLPLFPLQVVLFPNSMIPLHIFEERYKALITECIATEGEFGINFVSGTKVSAIGCSAVVRHVLRKYDDGRMDIVMQGRRRYNLRSYDDASAPYLVGQVEFLAPAEEVVDEILARKTISLYNILVSAVYKGKLHHLSYEGVASPVSYLLAQKAGLDLEQRQELLEMSFENERLGRIRKHLEDVIPKLDQFKALEKVVRSDGYL